MNRPDPTGTHTRSALVRLALSSLTSAALVVGAVVAYDVPVGSDDPAPASSVASSVASSAPRVGSLDQATIAHDHGDHDHGDHDHNDLTTKNALSRSGEAAANPDRTTPEEQAASAARVAAERRRTEPELRRVPLRPRRTKVPRNRYAMAGGCYSLGGTPVRFQTTGLGSYLLVLPDRTVLTASDDVAVNGSPTPSPAADWRASRLRRGVFTFRLADGRGLAWGGENFTTAWPTEFALVRTTGCSTWPEIRTNVSGRPHGGVTSYQEVRGWADPHVHGQTHEFLGGRVICSPPFHRYGVASALVDCPDHRVANGRGALLEDTLAGKDPGSGHDPVGWPTFKYWPAPHSLTHQMVYWKWLERAWRGGLRLHTSLLTENHVLCTIYPLKKNSCDDRDAVRLQAKRMREMQDYIDAQYGGPGRGWYRIVTTPFEARRVINQGKLAVVMGIETSATLGCNVTAGQPTCTEEQMRKELHAMRRLGVSQMELTNKFDNAFTGVAGDSGSTGNLTNLGNFISTGSFLRMRTCAPTNAPGQEDKLQEPNLGNLEGSDQVPEQDAIFGAIMQLFGSTVQPAPLYPAGPHCNQMGLTPMGEKLLSAMTDEHILFDPDHMSVAGRNAALTFMERRQAAGRPVGVISSHSWSTPDAYPRIYRLGGFIAPYAGDSTGFVEKWRKHLGWADERFYFGFGFGSDMNGFGAQGDPRGADAPSPVTYPFTGMAGVRLGRQHSGSRVYDINRDGVSHYGMYPDWVEDATHVAGSQGPALATDLARGAEAFLQTWERAYGIAPDSCRNPGERRTVRAFRRAARTGLSTTRVMRRLGQPWQRLGREFTFCARTAARPRVRMTVTFSRGGRVVGVRRG